MSRPRDPLGKAIQKAYRSTNKYPVDLLMQEQSRWQRKLTIAQNKLDAVRKKIDAKLIELATPKGDE